MNDSDEPSVRSPRTGHFAGSAGVVALAAAAILLASHWLNDSPENRAADPVLPKEESRARPLTVQALPITLEDGFTTTRRYPGEVRARRQTVLGFDRAERLAELPVTEGQMVKAGQLLAKLDCRTLEARRSAQEAQLAAGRARLQELESGPREETISAARSRVLELEQRVELAKLVEARRVELAEDRHASIEEADRARLDARASEAQLAAAQDLLRELENGTREEVLASQRAQVEGFAAELAVIDADLAKSTLEAPFDGCVAELFVEAGGVIAPGQSALRLLESSALEAWIGAPPDVLDRLAGQGEAKITSPSGTILARPTLRMPELDASTRLQTAIFELPDMDLTGLAVGERVELEVQERIAERGTWIPLAGLVRSRRGLWAAYVLAPDGDGTYTIEARELELIHSEGDRAFLRGSLAEDELVLQSGANRVVPGQLVRLADEARP